MIIGIGCDLVETARIASQFAQDAQFKTVIFTAAEIAYCDAMRYPERHYAARFAAKEALLKALGTGLRGGMIWRDVEVYRNALGCPALHLYGETQSIAAARGVARTHLSLSHTTTLAAAYVILESHATESGPPKEAQA